MKINLVIDSTSRAAGGLFDAERRLWQSLSGAGVKVSAFSLEDEFSALDANGWLPIVPESFPVGWPGALGRSVGLRARLLAEPADLIYRAGLWKWPSRDALEWCRKHGKREIIAPHGMLDPWAVKNSAWKKRLALMLYEREHLQSAACLRALCEAEARAIRQFGLKNPIAVIPNGIDLPPEAASGERGAGSGSPRSVVSGPWPVKSAFVTSPGSVSAFPMSTFEKGRKTLLYLGRIHPKKGLVNLIKAWDVVNRKSEIGNRKCEEWVLAIAGWDQGGHEAELKRLCDELGIEWRDAREHRTSNVEHPTSNQPEVSSQKSVVSGQWSVVFLGPQFGEDKAACYRDCDAFILPSFSEGLPMVVLEAWAHGKPVLMTPECNLPEGFTANAAIRIETNVGSIAQGLNELFRIPHSAVTFPLRLDRGESDATLSNRISRLRIGWGEGGRRPDEVRLGSGEGLGVRSGEVSNLAPCSELSAMGMRGRALVAEKFAWPKIAADMKSVYEWVLGGGPKPECVQTKS